LAERRKFLDLLDVFLFVLDLLFEQVLQRLVVAFDRGVNLRGKVWTARFSVSSASSSISSRVLDLLETGRSGRWDSSRATILPANSFACPSELLALLFKELVPLDPVLAMKEQAEC
jgi:hypothetical protein